MGGRYCGEDDADALNMVEIIFKQLKSTDISRGYFNIRERLPNRTVGKYDGRMAKLTSKLRECSIE